MKQDYGILKGDSRRLKAVRIVSAVLIILWMGTIFYFSSNEGDQSQDLSGSVAERDARFLYPDWFEPEYEKDLNMQLIGFDAVLRKGAHVAEYAALGALLAVFFSTFPLKYSVQLVLAASIGILYGISDEVHQSFVPGREGHVFDMFVDAAGAVFGAVLFTGISAVVVLDRMLWGKSSEGSGKARRKG